jgi:hypothetical protein
MSRKPGPPDQPIDPSAYARALSSLGDLVRGPLTVDRFSNWAAANASVSSHFLQDRYFGKIRWQKSIGRSLGPTLASGFRGEDWFHYLNWEDTGGEPIDIGKWKQVEPPSFWDLPDDGDFFQVSYGGWGVRPWVNAVLLGFAEHQPWDSPLQARMRRGYRVIVDDQIPFYFGASEYVFLPDATIVEVPIRVF